MYLLGNKICAIAERGDAEEPIEGRAGTIVVCSIIQGSLRRLGWQERNSKEFPTTEVSC